MKIPAIIIENGKLLFSKIISDMSIILPIKKKKKTPQQIYSELSITQTILGQSK